MDGLQYPSYAAATFVYALQVEPLSLVYHARAHEEHRAAWDLLNACRVGKLKCSSDVHRPISALPVEIIDTIASYLARTTLAEATCESWLYHGDDAGYYHPTYCCAPDAPSETEWPTRVHEAFSAATDYFNEHFTLTIPRCQQPCPEHHVCRTVHKYLGKWGLALSDCPLEMEEQPWHWLVSLEVPLAPGNPSRVEHSINLDTDHMVDFPLRKTKVIEPDWQAKQVARKDDLMRFKRESGVRLAENAHPEPEFFLVCLCERMD